MRPLSFQRLSLLIALLLLGCAPSAPGQPSTLTVFAAASLTEAFQALGAAFEAAHPGARVEFNFAGSQRLALQLQQGARADVFASADPRNMETVVAGGLVAPDAPRTFARNRLVLILPPENPGGVEKLQDLARPGLKLVVATPQAPIGTYTRQALANLAADPAYGPGFDEKVLENVVSNEENVKQVVTKVQLGEADAGIVYRTDVTPALGDELGVIDIPQRFNVAATYPIAALGAGPHADLAQEFVQFVRGPEGQRILEQWGFTRATE